MILSREFSQECQEAGEDEGTAGKAECLCKYEYSKNIQKKANISSNVDNSEVSADSYSEVKEAKPGSMMAKANMVRDYNEKNSRK